MRYMWRGLRQALINKSIFTHMNFKTLTLPLLGLALFASSTVVALAATPMDALNRMDELSTRITTIEQRFMHVRDLLVNRKIDVSRINAEIQVVEQKKAQVMTDLEAFRTLYNADPTGYQQSATKRAALETAAMKVKTSLQAYITELKTLRDVISEVLEANGFNK